MEGKGQEVEKPSCGFGFVETARPDPEGCTGSKHLRGQLIQKRYLAGEDLPLGLLEPEPSGTIDFRKLLMPSGTWWPLQRKRRTPQGFRVAIAFKGPRLYHLSALLRDGRQGHVGACRYQSGFLVKFPGRRRQGLLAIGVFAFRY